jgi:hypothetical protein
MTCGPVKQITAGVLDAGHADVGPADGPAVVLLHGWPYDIHTFASARMQSHDAASRNRRAVSQAASPTQRKCGQPSANQSMWTRRMQPKSPANRPLLIRRSLVRIQPGASFIPAGAAFLYRGVCHPHRQRFAGVLVDVEQFQRAAIAGGVELDVQGPDMVGGSARSRLAGTAR